MINGRRRKILIVECVAGDNMARWSAVFPSDVFEVQMATSVEEAFVIFSSQHPDLILIRTNVEKDFGRDLCRKVRIQEGQRHTGIVFLDHHEQVNDKLIVECLESGADDFVSTKSTTAEIQARVRAVLRLKGMTDELRSANHRLQVLSLTDELTGLANMRCFSQKYLNAVKVCRSGYMGLGMIMIDLDHFKSVNDSSNHLVGSYVIGEVGRIIKNSGVLGPGDMAARYGGDEFILYCSVSDMDAITAKAEDLRQRVSKAQFHRDGVTIRLTASFGCAFLAAGYNGKADAPIKAADLMLYRSKALGRDRVSSMLLHPDTDLSNLARFIEAADQEDGKATTSSNTAHIESLPIRIAK